MTLFHWTTLICAVAALAVGLLLLLAGRRHPTVPLSRLRLAAGWAVLALCPVLLVFLFFPDSSVTGDFGWGQATGAIGAFFAVWIIGIKLSGDWSGPAPQRREVPGELPEAPGAVLTTAGEVEVYRLATKPKRVVAVVPGGLADVRFADIWVNSENTNMQMARFYDQSISGVVRYLGAERDEAGEVVEDLVGAALAARMGDRRHVPIGTVFETEPGSLERTHNVKRLLHVATAAGEFGRGYAPAHDLGRCVRQVLQVAETIAAASPAVRSIVLPILGAGTARGDVAAMTATVLNAVVEHLEDDPKVRVSTVYVLAYTIAQLEACRRTLDSDARLQPRRSVARKTLSATPATS